MLTFGVASGEVSTRDVRHDLAHGDNFSVETKTQLTKTIVTLISIY